MLPKWLKARTPDPAILAADTVQPAPRNRLRKGLFFLLGGAGIAALLMMGRDNDETPGTQEPDVATNATEPETATPRNPDAGKYMPLVLYADGQQYPYAAIINDERMADERAMAKCLKGDYADACRPVAMLTRDEPGCIAYARDTVDNTKFHMNFFARVEDNTPFTTGNPTVSQYFCNDPILEREIQDGKTVSAPRPTRSMREVFVGQLLVLTQDVYLMTADGRSRGGPMIVEGSCLELSPGTGTETIGLLVTAWEKNGNGNNRAGFVEPAHTRNALEGEYTPATCTAVYGPNAPG